jgi:uncharacterized coiled-coil DUF342 family protein
VKIDEARIIENITRLSRALASWRKAYKIRTEIDALAKRLETLNNKYFEVKPELETALDELALRREKIKKLLEAKKQLRSEIAGLKEHAERYVKYKDEYLKYFK